MTQGDAYPCPCSHMSINSSTPVSVKRISIHCGGKIVRSTVPGVRATTLGPGARTHRPGLKRYWCHGCRRTFNDLTHTLLAQSKRSLPHWILTPTFLLPPCVLVTPHRQRSRSHISTSYRWCWWLRNAALCYEIDRQLEGTVEADDLYPPPARRAKRKAARSRWGAARVGAASASGRGHYDKDRPAIIAWVSRQGAVVIHATRDSTVKTVQKAANLAVQASSPALYGLRQQLSGLERLCA